MFKSNLLGDRINSDAGEIKSDLNLLMEILIALILYVLFLIPRILGIFFFFIIGSKEKSSNFTQKVFLFPFEIFQKFYNWFFAAKYTASLIFSLISIFILQIIFINPNLVLLESLMTNPLHLLTIKFYTVFTSIFLHGDIFHLLSNLLTLLIFGRIVERQFSSLLIPIFIVCGIISNIISNFISLLMGDIYFSLGASGAIAGLVILSIMLEPFVLTSIFLIPLPIFVIGWFFIFLDLLGLKSVGEINHLAHIGGYLSLIILFFFLGIRYQERIRRGFLINLVSLFFMFLLINYLGFEFVI